MQIPIKLTFVKLFMNKKRACKNMSLHDMIFQLVKNTQADRRDGAAKGSPHETKSAEEFNQKEN